MNNEKSQGRLALRHAAVRQLIRDGKVAVAKFEAASEEHLQKLDYVSVDVERQLHRIFEEMSRVLSADWPEIVTATPDSLISENTSETN